MDTVFLMQVNMHLLIRLRKHICTIESKRRVFGSTL